ncbi:MAG: malto-oligosyltrehalose synthase [Deltaproteobacteria bacterium]
MRVPLSTYRLQFNRLFDFAAARRVSAYLNELGVTDVYASPIFKARKGSMHGYDVVEHNELNPELGTEKEFRELVAAFRSLSMGWIQALGPTHRAFDSENRLLLDVLENGTNSRYFSFFDIEWDHPFGTLRGRVLVPLLGSFYADALENSEISLKYDESGLSIRYYDLKLPLRLKSYGKVFGRRINELEEKNAGNPDFISFLGALRIFEPLSSLNTANQKYDQIRHAKHILWDFYNHNAVIRQFMDANIAYFNGRASDPASFDPLDDLLSEQSFRLSFWKVATEEINYRRFFTINELISLRIEDEAVMEHVHRFVFQLIRAGLVTGLRVDHIDGLYDPSTYLRRIKSKTGGVYVTVEKILADGESLPRDWDVQGTTGYDFMFFLNSLFCAHGNEEEFTRLYRNFSGENQSYEDLVSDKKRLIIGKYMAGNIDNLATVMMRISQNDRYGRDITLYGLKRALVELAAFFPVYRTYIGSETIRDEDMRSINQALENASRKSPGLVYEMNFIRRFLLFSLRKGLDAEGKRLLLDFVMRFQQFTAPIMAKGFEDTALYVYNRLISLNEVGGRPDTFGIPAQKFHDFCRGRLSASSLSFNATATHDTKRGEDARARINVLSELPEEWERAVNSWHRLNMPKKRLHNGVRVPDENDEYFLYQTLIGSFPFCAAHDAAFTQRIKEYVVKAVREAKAHTAWIKPDSEYENGCLQFIDALLASAPGNVFLAEFAAFQRKIAFYGVFNSLSQVLLKCSTPGIPDLYQGSELWDLCLVDPDNRRQVDFKIRQSFLDDLKRWSQEKDFFRRLLDERENGAIKLYTVMKCLNARKRAPELFLRGTYIPLQTEGVHKDSVISFCRRSGNDWALAAAPLFLTRLVGENQYPVGDVWKDTRITLPEDAPLEWQETFTGDEIGQGPSLALSSLFGRFPLALLLHLEPRNEPSQAQ